MSREVQICISLNLRYTCSEAFKQQMLQSTAAESATSAESDAPARALQLQERACMISLCGVPGLQLFLRDAKFSLTNRLYWLGALAFAGVPSWLKRPKACNCPLQQLHTCNEAFTSAVSALLLCHRMCQSICNSKCNSDSNSTGDFITVVDHAA